MQRLPASIATSSSKATASTVHYHSLRTANLDQDYNIILSVFYVSYIIFEIPSNLLCKKLGPGWFIPTITLLFGICSFGTAFVKNRAQACGVRFLLGIFEAGMLPGVQIS